jgi:hypothetical protein
VDINISITKPAPKNQSPVGFANIVSKNKPQRSETMNLLQRQRQVVLDDYTGELQPLPEGTIKPGMKKTLFSEGETRRIHVYRPAISQNMRAKTTHPTSVVVDEFGARHYFHAVVLDGKAALKFDAQSKDANVYLVTCGKIMGFTDPNSDGAYDFKPKQRKKYIRSTLSWLMSKFHSGASKVPLVNCVLCG